MSDTERESCIDDRLDRIESKLDCIIVLLETKVSKECEKMSSHIDFINCVYEKVKNPLNYVTNKINYMYLKNDSNV